MNIELENFLFKTEEEKFYLLQFKNSLFNNFGLGLVIEKEIENFELANITNLTKQTNFQEDVNSLKIQSSQFLIQKGNTFRVVQGDELVLESEINMAHKACGFDQIIQASTSASAFGSEMPMSQLTPKFKQISNELNESPNEEHSWNRDIPFTFNCEKMCDMTKRVLMSMIPLTNKEVNELIEMLFEQMVKRAPTLVLILT